MTFATEIQEFKPPAPMEVRNMLHAPGARLLDSLVVPALRLQRDVLTPSASRPVPRVARGIAVVAIGVHHASRRASKMKPTESNPKTYNN